MCPRSPNDGMRVVVCHLFLFLSRASSVPCCQFLYFSYIFTMEREFFSSASGPSVAFKKPDLLGDIWEFFLSSFYVRT